MYICVKVSDYDSTIHKPHPHSDQESLSPPRDAPPRTDTEPQWSQPSGVQPETHAKPHWPRPTQVLPNQWPHPSQLNQLANTYPSAPPTSYPGAPPTSYTGTPPTSYHGGVPSYPYPSTLGQSSYGPSTITPTAPTASYAPPTAPTASYAPPTGGMAYGSGRDNPPEDYITTLGFDHLDMDQPIPDYFKDLDDSPPDSPEPVNEHVDMHITRPLDSHNIEQQQQLYQAPPTSTMYYPSNNTMGYGTQPSTGYYGPPGPYPPVSSTITFPNSRIKET